ncbi:MAG: hypothetical protein J2P21_04940 [Chloracidobacterium sp.]|nr:hypothetical protein [Chloracidobacterium sp.]
MKFWLKDQEVPDPSEQYRRWPQTREAPRRKKPAAIRLKSELSHIDAGRSNMQARFSSHQRLVGLVLEGRFAEH